MNFFSLSFTWDHMGEKFQMISPLKECNRFTPKTLCIPLGIVYTKVAQRTVRFQMLDFCQFFSFSLTWDYMGVKSFKMTSLKVHILFAPPNSCVLLERISTKVVKRTVKFDILANFLFFFWQFNSEWRILKCAI